MNPTMKPSRIAKSLCLQSHPLTLFTTTLPPPALQRRLRLPPAAVHRNARSPHSQASTAHQFQRTAGLQLPNPNTIAAPSIISHHANQLSKGRLPISAAEEPLHKTTTHHAPINDSIIKHPSSSKLSFPQSSHSPLQNTSHSVDPLPSSNSFHPVKPPVPQPIPTNPKPNRRPTKQVINLTPTAIEHLSSLLQGPTPRLIRIGVKNKGCAGMAYNLEYVEKIPISKKNVAVVKVF